MSHNLRIRDSDTQPWQTPTWVTDICLSLSCRSRPDGGQQGVLHRYLLWVRSHADSMHHTREAADAQRRQVNSHMEEMWRTAHGLGDRLEFYST